MTVKYKVSDFAKDLSISAKKVLDELNAMGSTGKKNSSTLEENELNYLLEKFSKDHSETDLSAYLNSAKQPAAPKNTEKKPEQKKAEKPAEKKAEPKAAEKKPEAKPAAPAAKAEQPKANNNNNNNNDDYNDYYGNYGNGLGGYNYGYGF